MEPAPRPPRPGHRTPRGGALARVRPAYIVLLAIVAAVVFLFLVSPAYRDVLGSLRAGILITIIATVGGYVGSFVLGLVLAAMALLQLGKRDVAISGVVAALLAAGAVGAWLQPPTDWVVVGSDEGRLAVVAGTPARAIDLARGEENRTFRTAADVAAAEAGLEDGSYGAALLPAARAPAGYPELDAFSLRGDAARAWAFALFALAVLAALLTLGAWSGRQHPLSILAEAYVDIIRGIPMLVVLIYVGLIVFPAINAAFGFERSEAQQVLRGVVALMLGYSAYMAEVFRAGIEAIPKGQAEAARSMGMSNAQTMRYVILPQAIRIVVPPLGNEFVAMLKDSSLLTILAVPEITQLARQYQSRTFETIPTWNTAAVLYLLMTLVATTVLKQVERRTAWGR